MEDMSDFQIPKTRPEDECLWFGIHKGKPLWLIPFTYIEHAVNTWDSDTRQYQMMEAELIRRKNM